MRKHAESVGLGVLERSAEMEILHCSKCNLVLKGDTIMAIGEGVVDFEFKRPCPKCGEWLVMEVDVFKVGGEIARILGSDKPSKEKTDILNRLFADSIEKNISREDVLTRLTDISPELASTLKPFLNSSPTSWAVIVSLLLFSLSKCSLEIKLDANKLINDFMQSNAQEAHNLEQEDDKECSNRTAENSKPKP